MCPLWTRPLPDTQVASSTGNDVLALLSTDGPRPEQVVQETHIVRAMNPFDDSSFPGGVMSTADLRRHGVTYPEVRLLREAGVLINLRRGWYAMEGADPLVRAAVASGGVLGCVSALKFWGVWTPPKANLHTRRSEFLQLFPDRPGVLVCDPPGVHPAPIQSVDKIGTALQSAALCLPDDELVTVMDSLLNLRLASPTGLRSLLDPISRRHAALIDQCDAAESGTETLVRLRLRRKGVKVRTQVPIAGVGRVDLLVGERLVIEVDSKSHHTSMANYHADRLRDRTLVALGYLVVRLTYEDVMFNWDAVWLDLQRLVRRKDHRRPRSHLRNLSA